MIENHHKADKNEKFTVNSVTMSVPITSVGGVRVITLTESAQAKIQEILASKGQEGFAVRLRIKGRTTDAFLYEFRSVEEATRLENDVVVDGDDFHLFIDADSADLLNGATIDFGGLGAGGFKIDNPNPVWVDEIAKRVSDVIHNQINPAVAMHSGEITLVDVRDNTVYIRMQGGCQGCGMAGVTLRQGIEKQIRQQVPEIKGIVDVTMHDQGESPYYAPDQAGASPVVTGQK
jgi:Fe/S biogenesis protein NfuA